MNKNKKSTWFWIAFIIKCTLIYKTYSNYVNTQQTITNRMAKYMKSIPRKKDAS